MLDGQIFYHSYDLDAATFKYGRCKGPFQGLGGITAAASTTVNASVAGKGTFSALRVGDYIWIRTNETTVVKRRVATKPSNDQITVSGGALTFTTSEWHFLPFDIGTGAEDGWRSLDGYERAFVEFDWTLADSLDVEIAVRGRAPAAKAAVVFTGTFAAAAAPPDPVEVTELIGSVRVGVKATTTFANTDDISIYLSGMHAR